MSFVRSEECCNARFFAYACRPTGVFMLLVHQTWNELTFPTFSRCLTKCLVVVAGLAILACQHCRSPTALKKLLPFSWIVEIHVRSWGNDLWCVSVGCKRPRTRRFVTPPVAKPKNEQNDACSTLWKFCVMMLPTPLLMKMVLQSCEHTDQLRVSQRRTYRSWTITVECLLCTMWL